MHGLFLHFNKTCIAFISGSIRKKEMEKHRLLFSCNLVIGGNLKPEYTMSAFKLIMKRIKMKQLKTDGNKKHEKEKYYMRM